MCRTVAGGSVTWEAAPGTGRCVSGSCLRDRQQRLVAQLGREQELRTAPGPAGASSRTSLHRLLYHSLKSWGLAPVGSFVPLPRTARQKKSAQSAREFFPFRRPGERRPGGWTGGEGQGVGSHDGSIVPAPQAPHCAPKRAGSPEVGSARRADRRRGPQRSQPPAGGADRDRAVSGQDPPNSSQVTISGSVHVPGLAEPENGAATSRAAVRAACPGCGPESWRCPSAGRSTWPSLWSGLEGGGS